SRHGGLDMKSVSAWEPGGPKHPVRRSWLREAMLMLSTVTLHVRLTGSLESHERDGRTQGDRLLRVCVGRGPSAARPGKCRRPNNPQFPGVLPSTLNAMLKQETGFSVSYWISHAIVLEAKRLLAYSTLDVKEIAALLGYADGPYFSRLFKKQAGVSPGAFRRQKP
ncbi:MAG: AraC family transcriptional regulator, partial [Hymenobacter sp.]